MSMSSSRVTELIKEASDLRAPFVDTTNIKNMLLWEIRAARSTDIAIINTTRYSFRLTNSTRSSGVWTESMLPANKISAHQSIIYGCQSRGFMTGATDCCLTYVSKCKKASFKVYTSNPFIGDNHAGVLESEKVKVDVNFELGNNNLVRFYIS